MNRYLISITYYLENNYGYGSFRKKIYAEDYIKAISKFENILNKRLKFGEHYSIREINSNNTFTIKRKR